MSKDNSNENNSDEQKQPVVKPQILLTFDSSDSINFVPEFSGVLPTQIAHAGLMLTLIGERQVNEAWTRQTVEQARKQAELAGIQAQIKASKN